MLLRRAIRSSISPRQAKRCITTEEINTYKTDSAQLARWLDVGIIARKGRVFDADTSLISKSKADTVPMIRVSNLNGKELTVPDQVEGKAKLIVFSFKHYGFSLVRTWIDPYLARFGNQSYCGGIAEASTNGKSAPTMTKGTTAVTTVASSGAVAFEICFVEYGFLSMAKSMFVNTIKSNTDPLQVANTGLKFGNVKVSCELLPFL